METQAKGTLHFHAIIYISGLPNKCEEFERSCSSPEFRQNFIDFTASICCPSSPFDAEIQSYPNFNQYELHKVSKIDESAHKKIFRKVPPATLFRKSCRKCFRSDHILRNVLKNTILRSKKFQKTRRTILLELRTGKDFLKNDKETERNTRKLSLFPAGNYFRSQDGNFTDEINYKMEMLRLILSEMCHNWKHSSFCF